MIDSGNIIEAIQEQQSRFSDELIPAYAEIGDAGTVTLQHVLMPLLQRSKTVLATNDVVAMVRVLAEMRAVE